jgi:hypothetical protein
MQGGFLCKWGSCKDTFPLESDLFMHLKDHTNISQTLSCEWQICERAPVYTHKGHLNDHIIGHMSRNFVSVYCSGCRTGYRNRQALTRHQRDSKCKGSHHDNAIPEPPIDVKTPVGLHSIDLIVSILNHSNLSPKPLIRGRSLDDIIEQEMEG